MASMVTLKTGLNLTPEEGGRLKNTLLGLKGVSRVEVLYPDRLLITYDARISPSTLRAALTTRKPKSISINHK